MTDREPIPLSRTDRLLVRRLQADGRITNAELARSVGMSESACLRRVKHLESAGLIDHYAAILDQRTAGYPLTVFVTITLSAQSEHALSAFERSIADIPEVTDCHLVTGTADYIVCLCARSVDDLARIHSRHLTQLAGVQSVTSNLALRTVVKRHFMPK